MKRQTRVKEIRKGELRAALTARPVKRKQQQTGQGMKTKGQRTGAVSIWSEERQGPRGDNRRSFRNGAIQGLNSWAPYHFEVRGFSLCDPSLFPVTPLSPSPAHLPTPPSPPAPALVDLHVSLQSACSFTCLDVTTVRLTAR